jgi:hypothetical protein
LSHSPAVGVLLSNWHSLCRKITTLSMKSLDMTHCISVLARDCVSTIYHTPMKRGITCRGASKHFNKLLLPRRWYSTHPA